MVTPSRRSVNTSKKEAEQKKVFVKGGRTHMLGRGSRTTTSTPDAAGPQTAGQTAPISKSNPKFAKGGKLRSIGGMARPARPA